MTTVLAIHSGGFTSRQWKKLAQLLESRYRVLAPDLIGYRADDRIAVGTSFHFSQDVAMLAALLDEPSHLVGHSYGGFLAMQLALAHPERVRSIAVYEPVTFGLLDEPGDAATRASIDQIPPYRPDGSGADDAWLRGFIDWWQGAGVWDALPEPTQRAFRDVGWKVAQEVASLSADRTDRRRYGTIEAPTLVLAGARTQPAELFVVQKLVATLPHATLELFPDLGHMGPVTASAQINAAIARHVDAH